MSKNFRSSFIDLLCCRYSKRHLCVATNSLLRRRAMDKDRSRLNSTCVPNDCASRPSMVSRFSQLHPIISPALTPPPRLTSESLDQTDDREELANNHTVFPLNNSYSCHITVGTQTNHRRRKHDDRSISVSYSPLPSRTPEDICA